METRTCSKCNKELPLTSFYKRSEASFRGYPASHLSVYEKNCKDCKKAFMQKNFRKYNYGITDEQYQEKLEAQNHACAICGSKHQAKTKNGKETLHIDHDHTTGNVRGLLCRECNLALGHMKDSTANLLRAIRYLEDYQ